MNITYLAYDKTSHKRLLSEELPDGVRREEKGIFKAGSHESFLIEFSTPGNGVRKAKVLSGIRDNLPSSRGVHILEDGASQSFAEHLFPRLAKYEWELRRALFLALDLGQHDETNSRSILKSIAKDTLSNLGKKLFFGEQYMRVIREKVSQDKPFSKAELIELASTVKEETPWDVLFRDCDMDCVKENFESIVNCRNTVMHHRTIKPAEYDDALRRLQKSTNALLRYSQNVCNGAGNPVDRERRAERASQAILQGIAMDQISEAFSSFSEIVAQNNIIISNFMSEYNEAIAANISGAAEEAAKVMANQSINISKTFSQTLAATTAMDQIQKSVYQAAIKTLKNTAIPSFQTIPCDLEKPLPHLSNEGIDKTKADEVSQDDEENNLL